MAGRVHEFQLGVFPPKKPVFGSYDVRRVNDRIFTGPRGSVMRYGASPAATDVIKKPYNVS
jgi:hypothetical protein